MVDYRTKIVYFQFQKEAVLEWKCIIRAPRGKFISYLKAKRMMSKGYIFYLIRVKNVDGGATNPSIHSDGK